MINIHVTIMYTYINMVDAKLVNDSAYAEVNGNNVLKVTEDQLDEAQKEQLEQAIDGFKDACLQVFNMVDRVGKVIQKIEIPTPCHITVTENPMKFQECLVKLCIML